MKPSKRLLQLRTKTLGYTQREMAKVFNVCAGAINLWENNERKMSGPSLIVLSLLEDSSSRKLLIKTIKKGAPPKRKYKNV